MSRKPRLGNKWSNLFSRPRREARFRRWQQAFRRFWPRVGWGDSPTLNGASDERKDSASPT